MVAKTGFESVTDLPGFAWESYDAFRTAHAHKRALVWVRPHPRLVFTYCVRHGGGLAVELALLLIGPLAALAFAVIALWLKQPVWLLGMPAALVGWVCATGSLACIDGCMPVLVLVAGIITGRIVHNPAGAVIGSASVGCWFVTSAGIGVTDLRVREQMLRSEADLLRLYSGGRITGIEENAPE